MSTSVPIGEFSRLSHLSIKALRHYHDIGLLVPEQVDPFTGYRRYNVEQVHAAQLISRLRSLRMPLPDIDAVLSATDSAERDELLRQHLERMEAELDRTRDVVGSLRELLTASPPELVVEVRELPAIEVLALASDVAKEQVYAFCNDAFPRLYATLVDAGLTPDGPMGGAYDEAFFTEDHGRVTAFVPLPGRADLVPVAGPIARSRIPAGRFACTLHRGPYVDFDRTYAALGSHVAQHHTSAPGAIRELYLVGPTDTDDPADFRTEICWPIAG